MKSIAMDVLQANFYFTFYTCFFITRAVYGAVCDEKIEPIQKTPRLIRKFPPGYFFGSIVLGIFVSLIFTPIIVGTMILIGLKSFTLKEFILFKTFWGGVMAAIWAPIFTLIALGEANEIELAPNSIWKVLKDIPRKL